MFCVKARYCNYIILIFASKKKHISLQSGDMKAVNLGLEPSQQRLTINNLSEGSHYLTTLSSL